MLSQQSLRTYLQAQRHQLPLVVQQQASLKLCYYVANTDEFRHSKRIAFYHAINGEVDPHSLIEYAWDLHKTCYLPICHPSNQQPCMSFAPFYPHEPLRTNHYGIQEPSVIQHPLRDPATLDLVFTPLVAFDHQGSRLGSGKGYYDRTFAYLLEQLQRKPKLIGLAYAFQQVEQLVRQPWDVPINQVFVVDPNDQTVQHLIFNY